MIADMVVPEKPNNIVMFVPIQESPKPVRELNSIQQRLSKKAFTNLRETVLFLYQENVRLRVLHEQDSQADVWVGAPAPNRIYHVMTSPVEFVPYFSTAEFED